MNVRVKVHGVLGDCGPGATTRFDVAMPDGVTVRELVHTLADHCGAPFCRALESSDARLPRHIRMFSDGQMLSTLEEPLVSAHGRDAAVDVVIMTPMSGG